ncbi:MAG: acetoin utilization deacetylase AcuC-like enzyme [Lentimonas sp.]
MSKKTLLKIAFSNEFIFKVPEGHKFPMEKYDLIARQLLHEGIVEECNFFDPPPIAQEFLLLAHEEEYLKRFQNLELTPREQRITGFKHNAALVEREAKIAEGTRLAADFALNHGAAMNVAGGTHHAFSNKGEGFCMYNDIAIAAHYLLNKNKAQNVLIIDLDVHQGNGTAQIFKENANVFTFSMHGKDNYPMRKEISDLDIELPINTKDDEYLAELNRGMDLISKRFVPDFVFYQAGVDVLTSDKLGKLDLTIDGVKRRDQTVIDYCKSGSLPLVITMGGGYGDDIKSIVDTHVQLYKMVNDQFF